MYSYKRKDIIQDIHVERLSAWDTFTHKIQEVFKNTKQTCIDLKERYDTWYRTYDFALAGHKTAWFIKYKLFPFMLWTILITLILFTLSYVVIQFEFATDLRPEFVDTWIKGLDKTHLPLLFQEKQGHPILLFVIWCIMFKCLVKYLTLIIPMIEREYSTLVEGVPSLIQTLIVLCMMNNPYIYGVTVVYMLFLFIKWTSSGSGYTERHGFNVYDKDGNHIGSFERY